MRWGEEGEERTAGERRETDGERERLQMGAELVAWTGPGFTFSCFFLSLWVFKCCRSSILMSWRVWVPFLELRGDKINGTAVFKCDS